MRKCGTNPEEVELKKGDVVGFFKPVHNKDGPEILKPKELPVEKTGSDSKVLEFIYGG